MSWLVGSLGETEGPMVDGVLVGTKVVAPGPWDGLKLGRTEGVSADSAFLVGRCDGLPVGATVGMYSLGWSEFG